MDRAAESRGNNEGAVIPPINVDSAVTFDPDYGPATNHPNDPRNDDIEVDEDLDPLEEAAKAEDEWFGNHPDYR